jgi:hypothetical protein
MRQRGRKSSASLAVLPLPPGKRQPPPASLSKEEAVEWTAIINRMPGGWFGRENQALLMAFCRHSVEATRLSGMLAALNDAMDAEVSRGRSEIELLFDDSMKVREQLLRMRERETRAASSLATRMRLTQQALYSDKKAPQRRDHVSPWERFPHEGLPHERNRDERDGD